METVATEAMEAIKSRLPALAVNDTLEAAISQAKQTFMTATKDIPPDLPAAEALRKLQEHLQAADLWTDAACNVATFKGHLALLQWFASTDACPLKPINCAIVAAEHHQMHILDWLRVRYPADLESDRACRCAAAWGRLDALKAFRAMRPPLPWSKDTTFGAAGFARQEVLDFLRSETPPCPWNAEATQVAAAQGHLEILKFLIAKGCPCESGALVAAVQHGQYQLADWLLGYRNKGEPDVYSIWRPAMHAADLLMLDFLGDRDLFKLLHIIELCIPVDVGNLVVVRHMIKHYTKLNLMPFALCQAIKGTTRQGRMSHPLYFKHWHARRLLQPDARPQHDEVLHLVYAQMPKIDDPEEVQGLCEISAKLESFSLVELASKFGSGSEPKVKWDAEMHGHAAANGDVALLRWLLDLPVDRNHKVTGVGCSNARMLLLVHGYGWRVPMFFQNQFAKAEACHWAFYGVAWRLRHAEPSEESTLGKLPDALIKKIACAADIDFSWRFSR